jgi:hypothetical protein
MASSSTSCRCVAPAEGPSSSASKADVPPASLAGRAGLSRPSFADPTLLTPDERLAAFGDLLAQAFQSLQTRQASNHCSENRTKQKRN